MKRSNILIGIGSVLLTLTAVHPQRVMASEEPHTAFELVAIGNQAFGSLIVNGEYQTALGRIAGRSRLYPFAAATNQCVALTMLGRLEEAAAFCDKAIEIAARAGLPGPRHWKGRSVVASQGALAYSNRGVMRVLRGDVAGATEDFRVAIDLKNDMQTPVHNFTLAESKEREDLASVLVRSN